MPRYLWEQVCEIRDNDKLFSMLPKSAQITIGKVNPIKYWAHLELGKSFDIKGMRPETCPICNRSKYKMNVHIQDYYNPYVWFFCCASCHMKHHRGTLSFIKSATGGAVGPEDWVNGDTP